RLGVAGVSWSRAVPSETVSQPGDQSAKQAGLSARQRGKNSRTRFDATPDRRGGGVPEEGNRLGAQQHAPRAGQAFLRDALQTWRLDGVGEITEILAGELDANVVRHVGAPGTLRASSEGRTLRVEVDDVNTEVPVVRRRGPNYASGYGMLLVDELA